MGENKERDPGLPDTPDPSNFPIGSPESRAAARFQFDNFRHGKAYYVEAGPDGSPVECVPVRAVVSCFEKPDVAYTRLDGETPEEFEQRVWNDLPVAGPFHIVQFIPADDPPDRAVVGRDGQKATFR